MNDNINDNINDNMIFDTIGELDSTWIQEFENLDKDYKNYYSEDMSFLIIRIIYVNKLNDIEKIREEKIILKEPGVLQKEDLLGIIKHNSFSNNTKYSLLSILKYNINIEPEHLKNFFKSKDKTIGSVFLQSVKNIDTIKFEKSITMFHDINELIIMFHQRLDKNGTNSRTKKKVINSNTKKKTKRKELKVIHE